MNAFEEAAVRRFEDEMVTHSRGFAPELCEVLGEEQLRVALRRAIARAEGYGFTFRGPIRLFIEMGFLFGSGFDTDPQYPWAAKILQRSDDQMRRAEELCAKVLDYQEKVSGPDGVNTDRALQNLLAFTRKPISFPANDLPRALREEMARVYPEKAAYLGEAQCLVLIREARRQAADYKLPAGRGETLVLMLMFAMGHGCTEDALYPWIAHTLKDDKLHDPLSRSERLEKKAITWLEHVVAADRKTNPT